METNGKPNQNFSMEQVMAFAKSPAGNQLLNILRQKGGSDLAKAQSMAASGDMTGAKNALSSLLDDPQIRKLMKELGG